MKEIYVDSPAWKLSGMAYRGGYYSAEEWEKITKVDPRDYPEYFVERGGTMCVTPLFREHYEIRKNQVVRNAISLGLVNA